MSLLKALMLCLVMAMTVTAPAHSEITLASQGGITDVLQIGRNAIVVTINRGQLPTEVRHELAIITLSDSQGMIRHYKCEDFSVLIPTMQLSPGICTVHVQINEGADLNESHEFIR